MMSRTAEPAGNPRYWPIYEAAAEAGLPVAFHAFGYSGWAMTNTGWPSFYIEEVSEHATSCQNQVTSLVVEGVFERLPDLKVVLIECGFAWLPSVAWRLDRHWRHLKAEVPHLRRAPSEVIREHVWVSTQPMEEPEVGRHLKDVMGWIGWDRILFATDYPHWDFDDPAPPSRPRCRRAPPRHLRRQRAEGLRLLSQAAVRRHVVATVDEIPPAAASWSRSQAGAWWCST
jgi:predicted TIM-barrel fold metal-dependent hydrolase